MTMMKTNLAIFLTLLNATLLFAATPSEVSESPEKTVQVFVAERLRLRVTGLPDEKARQVLDPFLSPSLLESMERARREQLDHLRNFPDEKPPWIEGDLFSSLFEGPHRFRVGEARIEGERAEVPVAYERTERGDTVKWTDTFLLTKSPQGWRIDDVRYGGTWDFSNQGTLKESLAAEE